MKAEGGLLDSPRLIKAPDSPFNRVLGMHVNGHDASVCVVEDGDVVEIVEFERVFREKRYRIFAGHPRFDLALKWLFEEYGLDPQFDAVALHLGRFRDEAYQPTLAKIRQYVPDAPVVLLNHHLCHAAAAYFTSPFTAASILSYDGFGNDGSTVGFTATGNSLSYFRQWPYRLGTAYRALGSIIGGIHAADDDTAGKTMGLTAYGRVIDRWRGPVKTFLETYRPIRDHIAPWEPCVADGVLMLDGFGPVVGANTFGGPESRAGQDFAATFQACWTDLAVDLVRQIVRETGCGDVCITGGSALNAITNYRIVSLPEVARVHFIPNPNDSGLAMGAALYCYFAYQGREWPGRADFLNPYLGLPVLDRAQLPEMAASRNAVLLDEPERVLAQLLISGKIIGVVQGRSEVGPRALGNRSILCDPRIPDMRDTLNKRVKGREWYRPFAPVVKREAEAIYFDLTIEVPYMSIIGYVRPQWSAKLPAVTHIDLTARLQTVTREQNRFLWRVLDEFEKLTGVAVLLNTSFNAKGQPIIARLSEAFDVLDSTDLDYVYSEEWLFGKC